MIYEVAELRCYSITYMTSTGRLLNTPSNTVSSICLLFPIGSDILQYEVIMTVMEYNNALAGLHLGMSHKKITTAYMTFLSVTNTRIVVSFLTC